jgi:lipopolysaccharide transport system ATP-binding protein
MSDIAIKVENLSKSYILSHRRPELHGTFRDVIVREFRQLGQRSINLAKGRVEDRSDEFEEFWALKDVSFEVKRGEVLAVVGRNGAGKSTLLKILSRITEPATGRVELRGRVASLLEVGTGFHPELTGRENIYLNGAVLGMTRAEIRKKFDEIVAFSEVENFLDTPVKRYSSGMYVRLAFSIAAHLEPEILIVDEVLAVGDADFQRKCLGRLDQAAHRDGRTVLFVSHDLGAVSRLAQSGLLLSHGRCTAQGSVSEVVAKYLSASSEMPIYLARGGNGLKPFVQRMAIETFDKKDVHESGAPLSVRVEITHPERVSQACFQFQIVNQFNQPIVLAHAYYPDQIFATEPGTTVLLCKFPNLRLNVGRYYLRTLLGAPEGLSSRPYEVLEGICPFEVIKTGNTASIPLGADRCAYFEDFEWHKIERVSANGSSEMSDVTNAS